VATPAAPATRANKKRWPGQALLCGGIQPVSPWSEVRECSLYDS
jgi:hypothetical protein